MTSLHIMKNNGGQWRLKDIKVKRAEEIRRVSSFGLPTNDDGMYKGDLQYGTLEEFLVDTQLPVTWAELAVEELGFAPIDLDRYWDDKNSFSRMNQFYRLFLLLVANKVEFLADVEEMLADTPEHREQLTELVSKLAARGIVFYAVPFDILSLLVLLWLGPRAIMKVGVYGFRQDIHVALNKVAGFAIPPQVEGVRD